MGKIVLNKTHLNASGNGKDINDLTFVDFRLPMQDIHLAHKILYVRGNRCRILKQRFPTEYSITKKRQG